MNGALWETRTDKMYNCQFAPDGRLTALSQSDGEWAIVVDDAESEEHADYLWGTRFNKAGTIAVPMQTGMEYGMLVDGAPWEQLYTAATDFVLSETGKTAAVVQTAGLGQADLEGFSKGIYTIAVDGQAWEECYLNAWSPCFDREGHRVASTVRVTPYEYTISINGQRWSETYPCAWEPIFEPKSGDVIAPIRKEGKWGLARNGSLFWKPMFAQCWAPRGSRHRRRIHLGRRRAFLRCLHRGLQRHPVELPFPVRDGSRPVPGRQARRRPRQPEQQPVPDRRGRQSVGRCL